MYYTHNVFLFALACLCVSASCVSAKERADAYRRADSGDQFETYPPIEAGTRAERRKPPVAPEAPAEPIATVIQNEIDAHLNESPPEARRQPSSLFTDAEIPPIASTRPDDDGGRPPSSTLADPPEASPRADASLSTDSAATRADSEAPRIPAPSQPGEIVITEVMANPKSLTDSQGEWFEIYNPSASSTYNLRGCEIADDGAAKCVVSVELTLPPLGWATVARNASPGFAPGYVCSSLSLTNAEPDQVIIRCGSTVIDRIAYDKAKEATSLALDAANLNAQANDAPSAWCLSTTAYNGEDLGTPGAPNAPCAK